MNIHDWYSVLCGRVVHVLGILGGIIFPLWNASLFGSVVSGCS